MRLEWKVFISSKPCRLIVVPRQEFIKHMFGKLLFFFVFPKLGISYKVRKKEPTLRLAPYFRLLFDNLLFSILRNKHPDISGISQAYHSGHMHQDSLNTRPSQHP